MNRQQIIATRDAKNGFRGIAGGESVGGSPLSSEQTIDAQKELAEDRLARKLELVNSRSQFMITECAQEWPK